MSKHFNIDQLHALQTTNPHLIPNIHPFYHLPTPINQPPPQLLHPFKIITHFIHNQNPNQLDTKLFINRLNEFKHSYYHPLKP
ncbi:hypothetical protein [Staphylococcus haemolyticus]|uniref:hypothetical protein n=1 Tax=Staphylococcus haemolyticus TaxID=1283 RepID=UPI00374ED791